jgi:cbb3-type cytochrome oxidase subunit 3
MKQAWTILAEFFKLVVQDVKAAFIIFLIGVLIGVVCFYYDSKRQWDREIAKWEAREAAWEVEKKIHITETKQAAEYFRRKYEELDSTQKVVQFRQSLILEGQKRGN